MKKICSLFALFSVLLLPFNAQAQETGFYAGGSGGWSMIDDEFINSQKEDLHSVDDSSLGWKFFAGYNLNQYLGAEIAYVDLGEATAKISAANNNNRGVASELKSEIAGFSFAATGRYPFTRQFDVFGKVGGFYYSNDQSRDETVSFDRPATARVGSRVIEVPETIVSRAFSVSFDGVSYFFGLGARYDWNENLSIRAEWERYEYTSDVENLLKGRNDEVSIDFFSAGFEYHF